MNWAFPTPSSVPRLCFTTDTSDSRRILKLASGMTNPGRLSDLGDVQKMIFTQSLPQDLQDQLNPFVQQKYEELWKAVNENPMEI
jgi:hypothetical protein